MIAEYLCVNSLNTIITINKYNILWIYSANLPTAFKKLSHTLHLVWLFNFFPHYRTHIFPLTFSPFSFICIHTLFFVCFVFFHITPQLHTKSFRYLGFWTTRPDLVAALWLLPVSCVGTCVSPVVGVGVTLSVPMARLRWRRFRLQTLRESSSTL